MANRCENELRISGKKAKIAEAIKLLKTEKTDLDFDKIIPSFGRNSHEWYVTNWGSMSNADDASIKVTTRNVCLSFLTVVSPPVHVVSKLSEKFPDLVFDLKYWECGVGYKGHRVYQDGNPVKVWESQSYRGNRGG